MKRPSSKIIIKEINKRFKLDIPLDKVGYQVLDKYNKLYTINFSCCSFYEDGKVIIGYDKYDEIMLWRSKYKNTKELVKDFISMLEPYEYIINRGEWRDQQIFDVDPDFFKDK